MLVDTLGAQAPAAARTDWHALARGARVKRFAGQSALLAFLLIVSVPIILPYFWMVVISFTARSGGVATDVLWTSCAVIVPAVIISAKEGLTMIRSPMACMDSRDRYQSPSGCLLCRNRRGRTDPVEVFPSFLLTWRELGSYCEPGKRVKGNSNCLAGAPKIVRKGPMK